MDWIKRNLYFLVGGVVALVLLGAAGWFLYSKWSLNNETLEKLNANYESLRQLNSQNPHPGSGSINNIQIAKDQQQQVKGLIEKSRTHFQPITPIPDLPKVTDRDFASELSRTISQLQRTFTNASVNLPPNYSFSFEAQKPRVSFAAGSTDRLAVQLGEIKAICDILFQAKVNYLDNIRRERVSADDQTGPVSDYLEKKSITNQLAVLTPYEVTFRCFGAELASVLSGFASSPYGFAIKTINVEQAPATAASETPTASPVTVIQSIGAQPADQSSEQQSAEAGRAAMMRRYGIGPGGRNRYNPRPEPAGDETPAPAPVVVATPARSGLSTVLDEKQLRVTLQLNIVKLSSPKDQANPDAPAQRGPTDRLTGAIN
jgi:hypothetical protein